MASSEVEFLEERLALLESWIENTHDDDDSEDLVQKREEYQGLIEETVLLQKKLRKTSKLLSKESSKKLLQKLSKKQDQYLNEIEEIMNYAESDVLFETDESIEPNELLGEPLETLMEQPGMEGSCASLNFSMADFMPKVVKLQAPATDLKMSDELHPIAENVGPSSYNKHNDSTESFSTGIASLFTISTANSDTYNYDVRTLRKKLKKVEKLLAAEEMGNSKNEMSQLNAVQVKKLRKKREQYTQALQHKTSGGSLLSPNKNDSGFEGNDLVNKIPIRVDETNVISLGVEELQLQDDTEEEEVAEEEVAESNIEQLRHSSVGDRSNNENHTDISHDRKTLKKKLKKVKKMIAATDDPEELESYKQKKKEYKTALEALKQQETDTELSSPSCLAQHDLIDDESFVPLERDDADLSPARIVDSPPQHEEPLHDENEEQIKLVQKKLRKTEKSIAKARKEDDPKKLKKMEKKRLEYQTSLDELLTIN